MKDWLEFQLPLFFSQWLVPTGDGGSGERIEEIKKILGEEAELVKFWKDNAIFILADIEQKWTELIPPEANFERFERFEPFGPFETVLRGWCGAMSGGG